MADKFRYPKWSLARRLFFRVIIERFPGNGGSLYRLRARQRNVTPNVLPVIPRFAPSVGVKRFHTQSLRHQGASRWDSSLTPAPGMAVGTLRRGETRDDGAETAGEGVGYVFIKERLRRDASPLAPQGGMRGGSLRNSGQGYQGNVAMEFALAWPPRLPRKAR